MKALAAGALAVTTVVAPFSTGAAHAAPPTGPSCGLVAVDDPQVSGSMTGTLFGGPLVLGDTTDPTGTYNGHIVCTVQVGTNDTHGEADAAVGRGAVDGPVTAHAGTTTFERGEDEDVYVCTSVDFVGIPDLYWNAVTGAWTTNAAAPCDLAVTFDDPTAQTTVDALAALLCPVLRIVLPPDGDIPLLLDCPPEGNGEIFEDRTKLVVVTPKAT